jgi:platelet-activating factor acetylhydrolase IB subunit alpha
MKVDEGAINGTNGNHHSSSVMKDILERKWTSIAKLKKEVDELTKQNKMFKESALCEKCGGATSAANGLLTDGTKSTALIGDNLPRQPEKYVLQGHKSRVTKVALHPVYSDVVSASEDGTLKLWDFD